LEFKNLIIWQKAVELAEIAYSLKHKFPSFEEFGLGSQLRRASVSIPSNIAEGSARGHTKEYIRFLYQARGSLAEVITQVELAKKFGYIEASETLEIDALCVELSKMINSTITSLKSKLVRS
jgi:four helix bundle protein